MNNPYGIPNTPDTSASTAIDTRTGGRAVDEYRPGGGDRLFSKTASGYEINASNKRDFMTRVAALQADISRGAIRTNKVDRETAQRRYAAVKEAWEEKGSNAKLQRIGEVLGDTIWETLGREAFARKLLMVQQVARGVDGRVKMRRKDVTAWQITEDVAVAPASVRQGYIYPPEFQLVANILISNKDIDQSSSDLLDEKYQDGLEQILRREDLICKALLDVASPMFNTPISFSSFTPQVLATMFTNVSRWGTQAATCVLAWDLWADIISNTDFVNWFDPVTKHELILEGRVGTLLGMDLVTDGFRYDTLQVLNAGEVYVCGPPMTLGAITQRTELQSTAIDRYNHGEPRRGWFMQAIEGMTVGNGRAVTKATRL